jgi:hypothetical protein
MLADRDSMLALAERRVREAEGKAAKLEAVLAAKEAGLSELGQKLAELEEREAQPTLEPEPQPEPLTPRFMSEELSKVISAAEESTSQILSRARASTRDQILEADRLWREVQAEVVRFAAWREQAERSANAVQAAMDDARAQIDAVPERIQSALAAAVEAMVSVDSRMAAFASASSLPLLAAPSGLEEVRARVDAPAPVEPLPASEHRLPPPPTDSELDSLRLDFDMAAVPSESDWPSLEQPFSFSHDDGDVDGAESDPAADEASHELAQFQTGVEDPAEEVSGDSTVWGA